jgi:hypothetical protein
MRSMTREVSNQVQLCTMGDMDASRLEEKERNLGELRIALIKALIKSSSPRTGKIIRLPEARVQAEAVLNKLLDLYPFMFDPDVIDYIRFGVE